MIFFKEQFVLWFFSDVNVGRCVSWSFVSSVHSWVEEIKGIVMWQSFMCHILCEMIKHEMSNVVESSELDIQLWGNVKVFTHWISVVEFDLFYVRYMCGYSVPFPFRIRSGFSISVPKMCQPGDWLKERKQKQWDEMFLRLACDWSYIQSLFLMLHVL